ncbi:hypothetical protein GS966_28995 [Rhodococcus hoagii]|nr:hypothetical protein [Prescottella equi]
MVARGVIARAIEHLEDDPAIDRIDVLYVCSNVDLARQNLRPLNVTGGADVPMPGRLGLLAVHSGNLKHRNDKRPQPVNLVSLTPGTSFEKGHQTAAATNGPCSSGCWTGTWTCRNGSATRH